MAEIEKRYSEADARKEAEQMEGAVDVGIAEDYEDAEALIEKAYKLQEYLEGKGLEKEDVEMSVRLHQYISKLNNLVFGDKVPVIYISNVREKIRDAVYLPPEEGRPECYGIYPRGMKEKIEKQVKNLFFDKDGKLKVGSKTPQNEGRGITIDEFLISIAAHEVRHRVQRMHGFKRQKSEFDADVIGNWAIIAFHTRKSLEDIAKIIKTEQDK